MYLADDPIAHVEEHSIEVQLPLMQEIFQKTFTFVPILISYGGDLIFKDIANAIVKSIKSLKKNITIIASSDMTHYESQTSVSHKDEEAIKAILKLDERELLKKIDQLNISMCGYIPAVIAMMAAKQLGAKSASLVAYKTSGDTSGDYTSVVGYAGIIMH
jgi:AmmeMemoRadiSam system protein B